MNQGMQFDDCQCSFMGKSVNQTLSVLTLLKPAPCFKQLRHQ
ncbi:hypothetical protein Pvag_1707 [Pantoea vagans C9-1]|nr:hypothetical protein Pvag_1707 [Pantoea vagans C9-1]